MPHGYRTGVRKVPILGPVIDFCLPALDVAPQLLGAVIRHGEVGVRITEVEAYMGLADPASHAMSGPGGRAAVMFGPPGHLYVYLSYGIHHCVNVICSPDGVASGVLLRAGEVVGGTATARSRRGPKVTERRLASGPGNLGQALGAELADSGAALDDGAWGLVAPAEPVAFRATSRIGISKNADKQWRFTIPGDPTVSGPRR